MPDRRTGLKRDSPERETECLGEQTISLMICQPESNLRDAARPLIYLNAEELVDVDLAEVTDADDSLRLFLVQLDEEFMFQSSQFAVGED